LEEFSAALIIGWQMLGYIANPFSSLFNIFFFIFIFVVSASNAFKKYFPLKHQEHVFGGVKKQMYVEDQKKTISLFLLSSINYLRMSGRIVVTADIMIATL
jgi:hypothetical protein